MYALVSHCEKFHVHQLNSKGQTCGNTGASALMSGPAILLGWQSQETRFKKFGSSDYRKFMKKNEKLEIKNWPPKTFVWSDLPMRNIYAQGWFTSLGVLFYPNDQEDPRT